MVKVMSEWTYGMKAILKVLMLIELQCCSLKSLTWAGCSLGCCSVFGWVWAFCWFHKSYDAPNGCHSSSCIHIWCTVCLMDIKLHKECTSKTIDHIPCDLHNFVKNNFI